MDKIETREVLDWLKLKQINAPLSDSPDQAYQYLKQISQEFEERFMNEENTVKESV